MTRERTRRCTTPVVLASAIVLALASGAPAVAQSPGLPSYATGAASAPPPPPRLPSYAVNDEMIHGRISAIDGTFKLEVHDDRGFTDVVRLHQGTVINPIGLKLIVGQSVTIHGVNRGKTFDANEIDTPYAYTPLTYY